jgi:hypothetical protein
MENKINIAELLKDCPKGMELDCTMYDNCTYAGIEDVGYIDILINTPSGRIRLTKEGCYIRHDDNAKCVIFPKGKTTWEGFVPPVEFKDGDILTTITGSIFIYKKIDVYNYCGTYVSLDIRNGFSATYYSYLEDCCRPATEEEKQKLFDAIKANGYRWNAETKTLEKLPKFKVGDRIKYKNGRNKDGVEEGIIFSITDDTYDVAVTNDMGIFIPVTDQDNWELVPDKFDINTLKTFDEVLVRDFDDETWEINFFSRLLDNKHFKCLDLSYVQCIPYKGNEYLRGTTWLCKDYFKTWKDE